MSDHKPRFTLYEGSPDLDRNPRNIQEPNTRRLSEFFFRNYYSGAGKHHHSRLSDDLAMNIAGDEKLVMELATMLAKVVDHSFKGEVIGFFTSPHLTSMLDQFLSGDKQEDQIAYVPVLGPAGIEPMALWYQASLKLEAMGYESVTFTQEHIQTEGGHHRPAIYGEGLDLLAVNGAIVELLLELAPQHLSNIGEWLAADKDDDGWIHPSVEVDQDGA